MNFNREGIDITFFVPCLNEEKNVVNTIKTIVTAAEALELIYEILIIDDNSSDNTVHKVEQYQKRDRRFPFVW